MSELSPGLLVCLAVPFLAAFRWPVVGLAGLLVGGTSVPYTLSTGTQSEVSFPMLLTAALFLPWGFRQLRSGESLHRALRSPFPALLAFLAIAVVSLLIASRPGWRFAFAVYEQAWFAEARNAPLRAQLGALGLFGLSFFVAFLVADQVRSLVSLRRLTALFIALGGLYVSMRLVLELRPLLQGFFAPGVEGSLMWTWLVALAFAQALFHRQLPAGLRFALLVLVGAVLYIGMVENRDWLAGWIPPLAAIALAVCLGAPRIALVAAAVVLIAFALYSTDLTALVLSADNEYSLKTRVAAWRVLSEIIVANPAFGLGPANYYHVTPLLPILGWNVNFSSHNNYVDIVAQAGLLGFACFALFVGQTAHLGWRLYQRAPAGFPRAYVIGALAGLGGSLVAAMIGDWLVPFVYNVGLRGFRSSFLGWFFLGGLLALDRILPRPPVLR